MSEISSQNPSVAAPPMGHMDALPAGTMLGEFELQSLLGVGGFGMVYKAYDHSLHRAVAIKEYMPSALVGRVAGLQVSVRSTADDQPFLAGLTSFISEARLLARFDHPSLVKVYRFWEANNTAYMVMPLYQGMTLKHARSLMSAPPSEEWLRTILWSVAQALKVLHDNGTIHRDVSPDNIFLQDMGPPVLLDLGAARRAVLDRGHKHTAILKVNYAPIEQYADATDLQEGPWTDLYALGAVVHGCVCNQAPLPATSRVVRDTMPLFSQVAQTAQTHFGTHYSAGFVDAILHTLSIEPAQRTQSVTNFCDEMQLQATVELSRFDWRAALGDSVSLSAASVDALPLPAVSAVSEHAKTEVYLPTETVPVLAGVSTTQTRASVAPAEDVADEAGSVRGKSHSLLWLGLVAGFVVALALGFWALRSPVPSLADEPPAQKAFVQESPVAPAPTPAKPSVSKPAPAAPANTVASELAPSANPKAAVRPTKPAVVAAPTAAGNSNEMCAEAGVFGRSMCIYRNCQKPENAKLSVCIEDRKKWEAENGSR